MNIKSISIKNFRVFKDKTTFQLRPFTILTGPNNSGKSSFIKFLLLLKEGIEKLNFSKGRHSLGSYNDALPWSRDSNELEFWVTTNNNTLAGVYNEDGELWKFNLQKNNKKLASFEAVKKDDYFHELMYMELENPDSYQLLELDIDLLIDLLKESLISILPEGKVDSFFSKYFVNPILYKISVAGEDVTDAHFDDIVEFQNEVLGKFKCHFGASFEEREGDSFFSLFNRVIKELEVKNKSLLVNYIKSKHSFGDGDNLNIEVNYSEYGELIFTNSSTYFTTLNIVPQVLNFLEKTLKSYDDFFERSFIERLEFDYISGDRGSQERVFYNSSTKEMAKELVEFSSRKFINKRFLQECFSKLGIDGELEIQRFENSVTSIYIKQKNIRLALSDLGFGYSQVIPIILKIHNLFRDQEIDYDKKGGVLSRFISGVHINKRLIIEEPEANLHPNLQSKLADLLVYIAKKHNLHFIIETHSEYFIRKLQYLTAKQELNAEDSVIYYFNDDKYVNKQEPKVKEIVINEDGGLSDSFGPGFFDEATRLQFDLLKLNKGQIN